MREFKAPNYDYEFEHGEDSKLTIFLAGSIEMGKAIDWQTHITNKLSHLNLTILNPLYHY